MKTIIVILSLLAATAAYAQFNGCPPGFCSGMRGFGGGGGGFSPNTAAGGAPLTNLRITNTGDFRITNTADNRAVSP